MTKIIHSLTELITIHAIGLAITNLVGWWIVHQITGKPLKVLEHAFFLERGWVYGTLVYAVLIQWYVWRAYLERPRPTPRAAKTIAPKPTLASICGPNLDSPARTRPEWVPPRAGRLQNLKTPHLSWNQLQPQGLERSLSEQPDAETDANPGRPGKILN